jgi:Tfp pilus assembly protein PilF
MEKLTRLWLLGFLVLACIRSGPPGLEVAAQNHIDNGVKFLEQGKIPQAVHQFEKALEKDPASFIAHFYLGVCLKHQRQPHRARAHFEKAIELNPNDPEWVKKVKREMEGGP